MENYLAYKIIKISERSSIDWKPDACRNHTVYIQGGDKEPNDYKKDNSRKAAVLAEAAAYEASGYILCKWANGKNDLEWIKYSDIHKEIFYEIIGRIPKYQRIAEYTKEISQRLARASKVWIQAYYE